MTMVKKWNDEGSAAVVAIKRRGEATANGKYMATKLVARNDSRVTDGAQVVTRVIGCSLDNAGGRATESASYVQDALER